KPRPVGLAHAGVALLLAAMVGVVTAQAIVPFLLAWETMAVGAYFLIVFESERNDTRRAGFVYLVLTHAGTLALIAMFLAWSAHRPDLTFAGLASGPALPAGGAIVLVLALLGFGVKAGIAPLHFWLPGAHAAAPSHVSALLSGVMLKMGIYGLLRVIVLIGAIPAWWGWLLLSLGLASGVLGVLWALGQHDVKRVLAYSSVENVGIIVMGLGLGVLGQVYRDPRVTILAFTAVLLHTLNHALFKTLLFLGAGALVRATHTRLIDRLGGVSRRMPLTALAFGIGTVAIIGLPPLNGFVGEWVALQALLATGRQGGVLPPAVFAAAGLALIAGLALACFVRVGGAVFLGRPRSAAATRAQADDWTLLLPMFPLALSCLVIGLIPRLVVNPASALAAALTGIESARAREAILPLEVGLIGVSGLGALLLGVAAALWLARTLRRRSTPPLSQPTWGCAYAAASERMQYTASSFGAPLLATFGASPRRVQTASTFSTDPEDQVLAGVMLPFWNRIRRAAGALRPLQQGRVTQYLQYIVLTVIVLLVILFLSVARAR
ncbi:MAG TPA: proton-conducting transporter membrane subunit, partial [Gemmatimonadales bacterium]|nr:proton-conducting transporter membrane subunit [Gemmatimonadales bacterium]